MSLHEGTSTMEVPVSNLWIGASFACVVRQIAKSPVLRIAGAVNPGWRTKIPVASGHVWQGPRFGITAPCA